MAGEARKTVTIVFTDVTGSTSLGEQLDPEALRGVMARYFETAQTVLERHGGTVEKFIGDAVMAVFGIPTMHEDDALRAVRAAAELRDELETLNVELEQERGVRIALRTGVNTGEVVVGDPSAQQFYATGDAVNVAARLEQAAGPGEILIGDSTRQLVRDAAELEPVDDLDLKGKTERVPAWRLARVEPGAAGFARRLESPLVGRREELERLAELYGEARDSRSPRLCTILGAPGVGKSRLTAELAAHVEREATVLLGRCLSYGEGITYWPLVEIVQQAEQRFPLGDMLAERPRELIETLTGSGQAGGSTEEAFWAVRKLFEALARERPLVIVLDDVHWAEATFLDLVEHVLEFAEDAPLLLVALARPEFLDKRPLWASQQEDRSLVRLEQLTDEQAETLIDTLAGAAKLPPETRRRIGDASEGNPLFLEQMLAMLSGDGQGDGDVAVPPTIQALLAARIDELGAEERAVVEPAAVIGQEFWREALLELCPADVGLSASLQRLVRKELIGRARSSFEKEDAFHFRHILVRDAAYSGIAKSRRAELHERFADWLERTMPEYEEIVGYHLEQAYRYHEELAPVGRAEQSLALRAAESLEAAGRRAAERGDMAATAALLRRALALIPVGRPGRLDLVPELAYALVHLGELVSAEKVLREAVDEAAGAADRQVQLRLRIEYAAHRVAHDPGFRAGDARRIAMETIPELEELDDDDGLARAWRLLSYEGWVACRWGEMAEALDRALERARRAGNRREEADDLRWLSNAVYWGPTPAPEAITRLERMLEDPGSDTLAQATVLTNLGGLNAMCGWFDEARHLRDRGQAIFREMGVLLRVGGSSLIAANIEVFAGDLPAAELALRHAVEVLERIGETGVRSTVVGYLAEVLYGQGKEDEAERFTEISEALTGSGDVASEVQWRHVRAKILARRGEIGPAEELMAKAVEFVETTDFLNLRGAVLLSRAELARLIGKPEQAPSLFEEAIRTFEQKGNLAEAERTRALLSELTG
jgi:class 3 adenylate cyclase/tetratricopeptide (TPR) repeat protein